MPDASISHESADESGQDQTFYLLSCLECDDEGGGPLILPFDSAEGRGKWAAAHTRGTGHDRWFVKDEKR